MSSCNERRRTTYGLDTISAGGVIAYTMEAYEKGIITRKDTDGIDLVWGNDQALVEIVHKMGKGEGIGKLMVEWRGTLVQKQITIAKNPGNTLCLHQRPSPRYQRLS